MFGILFRIEAKPGKRQELIDFLREHGFRQLEEIELVDEDVRFSLPSELMISIQ